MIRAPTNHPVYSLTAARSLAAALLLLGSLLLLAGCTTLGPDYTEPSVDWLEDWQPTLYDAAVTDSLQAEGDLAFWWRIFADPVLEQLVMAARTQNPTLRIAGLRILESRAALGIAGSTRFPQVETATGSIAYVNSRERGGITRERFQELTAYEANLNVGWELDFWGRFRRGIEAADANYLASLAEQQNALVLLTAEVADLYFAYRTTGLRITMARSNVARQHRSLEITERLFRSGQNSELDYQQAKTQYLSTLATVPDLENTQARLRNALATLLGRPPGAIPELTASDAPLPTAARLAVDELPAQLLLRRPDLRAAAWQVATQSAQLGIAAADYYPAISLVGTLGWAGTSDSRSPDNAQLIAGPSMRWNIFDHGRIANNVRLQDARLQQLIERFGAIALAAANEIDDAAIGIVSTGEQQQILRDASIAAERSLELANTRFLEGYADFQRVLDAQRVLYNQQERELILQGAHVSSVIALYKALGGGWTTAAEAPIVPRATLETMGRRTDWGHLLEEPGPDPTTPTSSTGSTR